MTLFLRGLFFLRLKYGISLLSQIFLLFPHELIEKIIAFPEFPVVQTGRSVLV